MLTMGSLLVGVGILLAGLLALFFRHPRAPRWTRPEMVAMLAVVPVTGVLGFGLGYVLVGAHRLLNGAGELYELAAPAAVALLVAGWIFYARRRLQAYGVASAAADLSVDPAATPKLTIEEPPGPTPEAA
jgi:heme A synthase